MHAIMSLSCHRADCFVSLQNHECSDGETCHVETEQCNVEPCPLHAVCRPGSAVFPSFT